MPAQIADIVPEQQLRDSFRKHATLAQLNRMWQFQERAGSGLVNLLDMMMPDAAVHSSHLNVRGHDELLAAMAKIPIDWRAGHILKDWRISVGATGTELKAAIAYLTEDAAGTTATADASYDAVFTIIGDVLPKLARIEVEQGSPQPGGGFIDMFATHRACSAVHYFLALVENPARDPEPFTELLATDFSLNYTDPPITSLGAMRSWVAGPLSSVIASEHDLHAVICEETGPGIYAVTVRMKSQAMFPDKSGAISRNTQHWTMTDDITQRFPRISEIRIDRDSVVLFDTDGSQTG